MKLLSLLFVGFQSFALDIEGHRGARWVLPENTLPAFEYAIRAGVDTLELDMHVSKDDVIVISHDSFISPQICQARDGKPAPQGLAIRSLTLDQIKGFDCGSKQNPRFPSQEPRPGTSIPTLEEVFQLVNKLGFKGRLNIETKGDNEHPDLTPDPDHFVDLFVKLVRKFKFTDKVLLQSFDYRTLKAGVKIEPKIKRVVLAETRPENIIALLQENQAYAFSPNYEWLKKSDVDEIHQKHFLVIPWTPNQPEEWKKLIAMGVDGIITDNPKPLIELLKASK